MTSNYKIMISVSDDVRKALNELGRTEDVKFSTDCRRLAIAGFLKNNILIVNTDIEQAARDKRVTLSDCITITSQSFNAPHGLFFIDNETIIVVNREGAATILKLPQMGTGEKSFELSPLQTIRADHVNLLRTPGSVTSSRIGLDLYEILICNNYGNYVTRHILDARNGFQAIRNEVLLSAGLDIPDGIAVNQEWSWIAVSNHNRHNVLMFKNDPNLNRGSEPDGILRSVICPHGVRFTMDDNFVLVADAGAPYVHIYAKNGVDWKGEREPITSIRVMDDNTYLRGRYNPEEGGPKGVDIASDMSVFVTTCTEQTLAFFDLEKILEEQKHERNGSQTMPVAISSQTDLSHDAKLSREVLVRELLQFANTDRMLALQKADLDATYFKQIQSIYQSRSWRITAPLRWFAKKIRNKHS